MCTNVHEVHVYVTIKLSDTVLQVHWKMAVLFKEIQVNIMIQFIFKIKGSNYVSMKDIILRNLTLISLYYHYIKFSSITGLFFIQM